MLVKDILLTYSCFIASPTLMAEERLFLDAKSADLFSPSVTDNKMPFCFSSYSPKLIFFVSRVRMTPWVLTLVCPLVF